MRDVLYIIGLLTIFGLLAMDFPSGVVKQSQFPRSVPFASFVELSPSVHALCLESARTSWQVRSGARGSLIVGSLDSGIPLLADCFPEREKVEFKAIADQALPVGAVDVGEYSLMPVSEGMDSPILSTRPIGPSIDDAEKPFSRSEMLSVDHFRKIKEIMQ